MTRQTVWGLALAGVLSATALTASALFDPRIEAQAQAQSQGMIDPSKGFADLVDRVMPAVISVQVKFQNAAMDDEDRNQRQMPPEFRDFFEQFPQFRGQPFNAPREPRGGTGQGSGFIITPDGYAVTNNHVVRNAEEVTVKLHGGEELSADVIGTDPKTDLALIKIKGDRTFPTVKFADTEPRVGDWVMAVGNPFGLTSTVTTGIISARGRDIGSGPYDDYLQIDASINRGNSGGPAFNLEGEVVGVNTAIFSPSGGSVGIGFAIPASITEDVVASLKSNGAVTRGWLGVQIQPVTDEIAESLGLSTAKGAIVSDVTANSPALKAGFKTGDTILKVDGIDIDDARDLARKVAGIAPGKSVPVEIVRDGKPETLTVAIGAMPADPQMASAPAAKTEAESLASMGLTVVPAPDGAGVQVSKVAPDSAAAERGLKAGDIIVEVAGQEVHSPADVTSAISKVNKKRVLMLVRSGDGQRFVSVPLGQS
jgi:serine protease Do